MAGVWSIKPDTNDHGLALQDLKTVETMEITKKHLLAAIAIIILLITTVGWYTGFLNEERNRWQKNYNSMLLERDSVNGVAITRELTINELKDGYEKELMVLKMENISINRLLRYSKAGIKTGFKDVPKKWKTDTLYLPSNAPFDSAMLGRFLKIDSSCVSISIFEPDGSDTAYVSGNCDINLTLAVYRGKRTRQHHLFGMKLFRSGPRQPTAKAIADCPGAVINLTDIEIKR